VIRPIKFRAWLKNRLTGKSFMSYSQDGEPASFYLARFFEDFDAHQVGVLMQFTGLHDKNGKEIWEGDIVTGFNGLKGEVVFLGACFIVKWNEPDCYPFITEGIEVLGNIYENPELLKDGER